MILAELAQEAGVPDGVLNIVHGAHDTVNGILDAPEIRAISFVGGDNAGKYIHKRGTEQGKRVQSNMAAKNHCVSRGRRKKHSKLMVRCFCPTRTRTTRSTALLAPSQELLDSDAWLFQSVSKRDLHRDRADSSDHRRQGEGLDPGAGAASARPEGRKRV